MCSLKASTPGEQGNGSPAEVMEQQDPSENNLKALQQVAGFHEAYRNTKSLPSLQNTGAQLDQHPFQHLTEQRWNHSQHRQ